MENLSKYPLQNVQDSIVNGCANCLYNYRVNCAKHSTPGQLILPEAHKTLPLYALGLTKCPVLRSNSRIQRQATHPSIQVRVRADERAAAMLAILQMPVHQIIALVHPRLFELHRLDEFCDVSTTIFFSPFDTLFFVLYCRNLFICLMCWI